MNKWIWYVQLACFGRHCKCWKVYTILEQHMLPSRRRLFQQDNAKPHTVAITTAWLRSRRVRVLNWPASSPDRSPIETIWHISKIKIRQRLKTICSSGNKSSAEVRADPLLAEELNTFYVMAAARLNRSGTARQEAADRAALIMLSPCRRTRFGGN